MLKELDVYRNEKHKVTVRPAQKPLELMRWLVRLVTPPEELVLDPFAGVGTTLVAAKEEGFNWLGCELNEEYAAVVRARVEAAVQQVQMRVEVDRDSGYEQIKFML